MRKGRLTALVLALILTLPLAACGKGGSDDAVTLTVMGRATDLEKRYLTAVFQRYQEATGNRLELISYADGEFERAASQRYAKGDGADILMHFHSADLDLFDPEANFLPLNDQPWAADLTDSALAYCTADNGDLLGLPFWENSLSGCYYNKTILDSLGLEAATTQAEFDMLCQALQDAGYTPICWPGRGCSWMYQFGLDPVFADDPDTLAAVNSGSLTLSDLPAVRDMAQWLVSAADRGWFGRDYAKVGWGEIAPALASGEAVMTFIWDTWFYTDFTADGPYTVDDFAVMPVFLGTAEEGTYEGGNLNMMMVNRDSPRREAALDFLAFCAAPENYNAAFDGIATVNCFQGQTTNIQSHMVTDAAASIAEHQRVSTAASKLVGYSGDDMVAAMGELFAHRTDVPGCVALMDQYRAERLRAIPTA